MVAGQVFASIGSSSMGGAVLDTANNKIQSVLTVKHCKLLL